MEGSWQSRSKTAIIDSHRSLVRDRNPDRWRGKRINKAKRAKGESTAFYPVVV